ncbi:MAG: DegT/DnrJ/EryC1/StrS family aminotransferase [Polyangiaceae bacterium]
MPRIFLSPPHLGDQERTFVLEAMDTNWVGALGPQVDAFEREFAAVVGSPHAAAVSSGTAALHLALLLVGVKPGDEVYTSTLTFAATANPITYVGARPVFVDCDRDTWNMSPALLAEALDDAARRGALPAAVVAVDLYGQCADLAPLAAACERHGVPLIEDAAEALGATYRGRPAGTVGAIGIFSFNGNKIITSGGGGMLVSTRSDWIERARFLATQARDPAPHYQHSTVGYNYRLSSLAAAMGRGQLRVLSERVSQRRRNNEFYRRALGEQAGIDFMPEASYGRSTFWLTCITVDPGAFGATREDIRLHLESRNIECRPVWKPMHMQPVFSGCRSIGGGVAEALFLRGLCLPSGSSLTDAECDLIVAAVLSTPRSRVAA